MEYKKFGEMSRDEQLKLMAAWLDGEAIEARDRLGSWGRSLYPSWMENGIYRIATRPVVKPSINWDHVAERFMALAVDKNGYGCLMEGGAFPVDRGGFWKSTNGIRSDAGTFASFSAGGFLPGEEGVKNWQDSLVFRPGHEPKEQA